MSLESGLFLIPRVYQASPLLLQSSRDHHHWRAALSALKEDKHQQIHPQTSLRTFSCFSNVTDKLQTGGADQPLIHGSSAGGLVPIKAVSAAC